MRNFWRGYRKASDLRERADNAKIKADQLAKLPELMYGGGGADAEREFVIALQEWKPGITDGEVQDWLKHFRNGVSGEQ
jgi:hypothetical protein